MCRYAVADETDCALERSDLTTAQFPSVDEQFLSTLEARSLCSCCVSCERVVRRYNKYTSKSVTWYQVPEFIHASRWHGRVTIRVIACVIRYPGV